MAHILVIESDPGNAGMLAAMVEDAGHTAVVATTPERAQGELRADGFDLILADVWTFLWRPVRSMTLRQLRLLAPTTPIIALTSLFPNLETPPGAGIAAVLPKPFEMDELLAAVDKALESRGAAPERGGSHT